MRIPSAPLAMPETEIDIDSVIFGGGVAGLFALARLRAAGYSVLLLESAALGQGQTRCAQGIIHGGLKYSLSGLFAPSSNAVRDMPQRWRQLVAGSAEPALAGVRVMSECCWLWRSDGLAGRLAMFGARMALRVKPEEVPLAERPEILHAARGPVLRLDEPVLDPVSVLEHLAAAHAGSLVKYRDASLEVRATGDGDSTAQIAVHASDRSGDHALLIRAGAVILAAGVGNERLRERFGRPTGFTQRRPLHQVLVRSPSLPPLFGHCVDGDATRVTITSAPDDAGRVVWHCGGRLAEEGTSMNRASVIARAQRELAAVLPGAPLEDSEWASYMVDRAEPLEGGRRPEDARVLSEGRILSLWPTKMALAPRGADRVLEEVQALLGPRRSDGPSAPDFSGLALEAPTCAAPPWHDAIEWSRHP